MLDRLQMIWIDAKSDSTNANVVENFAFRYWSHDQFVGNLVGKPRATGCRTPTNCRC